MARDRGRFVKGQIPWNKGKPLIFKNGHPQLGKKGKLAPNWRGGNNCIDCGIQLKRIYSYIKKNGIVIKTKQLRCKKCNYIYLKNLTPRIKIFCKECNEIIITRIKRNRTFCNKICMGNWLSRFKKEQSFNWKGGYHKPNYGKDFTEYLREHIRNRDNHKCQLCGVPEIEIIRKLDIHHTDYNRYNNLSKNLISLCLRCHNKTNHNREYWKVYFSKILQTYEEKIYGK